MKSSKINLGLLAASVTLLCNFAMASVNSSDVANEELSLGKSEATESAVASNLADDLSIKISEKLNQDSTSLLPLVIMIESKVKEFKAIIYSNPNEAYIALSTLDEALVEISNLDLQAQYPGSYDSDYDSAYDFQTESTVQVYKSLELKISKVIVQ